MGSRVQHSALVAAILLALLFPAACGVTSRAPGRTALTAEPAPLDIGIRLTTGEWVEIASYRGGPLVLFVFATFDGTSQAMLRSLRTVLSRRPNSQAAVRVIGIAAQPNAALLADAWVHALDPPFAVGFDPSDAVQKGLTALGELQTVPALFFIDARGFERGRLLGFHQVPAVDGWLSGHLPR